MGNPAPYTRLGQTQDGRWVLIGVLSLPNGGSVTRSVQWDHEPTHEELDTAARHMGAMPEPAQIDEGEGHRMNRKVTRLGTFFYGTHWGPPTWRLPRILVKVNRQRLLVGAGWLRRAYSASYHPFDRKSNA